MKAGAAGGHRAATRLKSELEAHLTESVDYQPHWRVMVRVYVKLRDMVRTYTKARIVADSYTVRDFFRGFNEQYPLFEVVDAGDDSQGADTKIKGESSAHTSLVTTLIPSTENFELFAYNAHCKHVVLAASSDRDYVGFLRRFDPTGGPNSAITLIESTPFPAAFHALATQFNTIRIPSTFRSTKITTTEQSPARAMPLRVSYAFATAMPSSGPATAVSTRETPSRGPRSPLRLLDNQLISPLGIHFNAKGQRIDEPLAYSEPEILTRLKALKLCNRYFLSKCTYTDCTHKHDYRPLSRDEKVALRRIARYSKCSKGSWCEDKSCVAAHICPHGDRCEYGDECEYPHVTDRVIVEVV